MVESDLYAVLIFSFAMRRTLSRSLSLLSGLGMVFIGTRFLVAPRVAAAGYGVALPPTDDNYAFQYAKGVRDVFSGLLLVTFAGLGYDRPLAWVALTGALIPSVDLTVVRSQPNASLKVELPHVMAISVLLGVAAVLFNTPQPAPSAGTRRRQPLSPPVA